jgi:hypothetical protein
MLDLDEAKEQWAAHDRKLDESIRLNRRLLIALNLKEVRAALQGVTLFSGLEAVAWLAIVGALGDFIYEHVSSLRLALPAVALDLFSIGMLGATVQQIAGARRIDYGQPVVGIQKQLENLRISRIRMTKWALLAGTVVWPTSVIVASKVLFGLEAYNAAWVWANVIFGLSLIPLAVWLSKRFGDRMGRSPFIQRIMNDIAGRSLTSAAAFLANLSEFEDEGR